MISGLDRFFRKLCYRLQTRNILSTDKRHRVHVLSVDNISMSIDVALAMMRALTIWDVRKRDVQSSLAMFPFTTIPHGWTVSLPETHDDVIKWKHFPRYWPFVRSFDVFFDPRLNELLSKQSWGRWFETPLRPLWRHSNAIIAERIIMGFHLHADKTTWVEILCTTQLIFGVVPDSSCQLTLVNHKHFYIAFLVLLW